MGLWESESAGGRKVQGVKDEREGDKNVGRVRRGIMEHRCGGEGGTG